MAHSRFGGSVMHRIMACPGSVKMAEGVPNPDSPYAAEGTLLHDIGSTILTEDYDPRYWDLTDEQQDVVDAYVDFVRGQHEVMTWDGDTTTLIEQQFSMPDLHKEFFGTADCVLINDTDLKVIDLKCGAGVKVEADYDGEPNPQLMFYLLGVLASLGVKVTPHAIHWPREFPPRKFEIVIIQPRAGGIKRRTVTDRELATMATKFFLATKLADNSNPPLKSGSHCKFCLGVTRCPELRNKAVENAQNEFGEFLEVSDMSDEDLSKALDTAALMETWIKAVRDRAFARLKVGYKVKGYKIVEAQGIRRWRDEDAAGKAVLNFLDTIDETVSVYDRKLKSPTQMEATLKKAKLTTIAQKIMDEHVTRNVTQKLVSESDARNPSRLGPGDDFD